MSKLHGPRCPRMPAPMHVEIGEPLYRYCELHKAWYSIKTGEKVNVVEIPLAALIEKNRCAWHEKGPGA